MVLLALVLALAGPPKLPPIGGRAVPAPEPTTPTAPAEPTAKPSVKPSAAPKPPAVDEAAKTPADEKPSTAPATPAVKPPLAPVPTSPTIGPERAQPATALRVVEADEVERWTEEDRRHAKADAQAKRTDVKVPKPAHEGPVLRTASEEPPPDRLLFRRRPYPPKRSAAFVLGYRYFRIKDALGRQQDWHLASLEVAPLRRYVRLNLITEFGIEGGEAARAGDRADMMLLERIGLGVQYPHFVTPLLEFQAGVGGARVELFQRNDLALVYTLGVDAGAQVAVTKWMYLHAVVGWIRPTFRWPERSATYDRFTFKVGVGF